MKIKNLIAELQKLDSNNDICITDINENIYAYDFDIFATDNDIKIILPLHILNHEWREDIAEKLYR